MSEWKVFQHLQNPKIFYCEDELFAKNGLQTQYNFFPNEHHKTSSWEKSKTEGLMLPDLKVPAQFSTVAERAQVLAWKHIQAWWAEQETNPYVHNQRMFVKGSNNSQWGKESLQRQYWEIQLSSCKRINFDPYFKAI